MKGSIGTATYLSYTRPYWGKVITRLNHIDKLSPEAKARYKAINLYSSGDYSLKQICEIFEINRSTFYRWRKKYKPNRVQSLEDRSRRPHKVRSKVVRNHTPREAGLPNKKEITLLRQREDKENTRKGL